MAGSDYTLATPLCECGNTITKVFKSGKPGKFCSTCREKQSAPRMPRNAFFSCAHCGVEAPQRIGSGKARKYCGARCREAANVKVYETLGEREFNCVQCGGKFSAEHKRFYCTASCKWRAQTIKRYPGSVAKLSLIDRTCTCIGCGEKYQNKRAGKSGEGTSYCSRECAFKNIKSWRAKSYPSRKRSTDLPGAMCSVFFKTCLACAGVFTTRWSLKVTCSPTCAHALSLSRLREKYEPTPQRVCRCKACGIEFMSCRIGKFCSVKCANRASDKGKHSRRARRFGVAYEFVDRLKVFARDGWKCQICGRRTPQSRMGSMKKNAPELDHRIPISKGGGHLYSNVQCSCRQCNGEKGNKRSVGQLPMFAA